MTTNYNKVYRDTPSTNHSEFLGMKMHGMGDYILYGDYDDLLKIYKELITKVSDAVADSAFEE